MVYRPVAQRKDIYSAAQIHAHGNRMNLEAILVEVFSYGVPGLELPAQQTVLWYSSLRVVLSLSRRRAAGITHRLLGFDVEFFDYFCPERSLIFNVGCEFFRRTGRGIQESFPE